MIKIEAYFKKVAVIDVRFAMRNQTFLLPLVVNDTAPKLQFRCRDDEGTPIDLSGKQVDFYMRRANAEERANSSTGCTVTNASGGVAEYVFQPEDLNETGTFFGDLSITEGSTIETASDAIRFEVRDGNKGAN